MIARTAALLLAVAPISAAGACVPRTWHPDFADTRRAVEVPATGDVTADVSR